MADTVAERAGETVQAIVENATAVAEQNAEQLAARAAAADATNEILTEAALRDRISQRVDDCEEDLAECHGDVQNLETEQALLRAELTAVQTTLAELRGQVTTLLTTPPHSISERPPSDTPNQSGANRLTPEQLAAQANQNGENADDHRGADEKPPRKARLV